MPNVRISESEGARDEPLIRGAPYQRKNLQPDYPGFVSRRRSAQAEARRRQEATRKRDDIDHPKFSAGAGKASNAAGKSSLKAMFNAVKKAVCRKDEAAPQPRRRRRGETDKGFVAAYRAMLRRARKPQARTQARATGGHGTFADLCASAGVVLSDTLDYLNSWQENAENDSWHEDEISATFEDYFPQP